VSPIKSLFCNINLDETEYDLPLPGRRSKNLEYLDLNDEIDESGIERNKVYMLLNPLYWISRNLIMKVSL